MEMPGSTNDQENNESMIDYTYLNEITGGDEELRGELINMFEAETVVQLSSISNSNKDSNLESLKQAIHKYRSSLFSVGLLQTANKYKEIETTLKRNEPIADLTNVLLALENESKKGLEILKNL
jgi:HPt (histidine-containing phosphotransfer) domain-containing protein